jgi:AcrR family transcriptional regulator
MDGTKKDLAPLYRRLPHGPHGMNREEVARHQRARLYGGMIESISERGYSSTTVAHVIGLAGVSRRAFYEQFSNKQECFLATYDIVVARSRKQVLEAWNSERGWANRLHASYKTFLDDIVADPKGAHLVLVDSLGIGLKARERLHLAGSAYERLVAAAFRASPDTTPLPPIASHAIVGGVRHVVFNRLREGRVSELRHLADELLDWVEAYRSPATTRLNMIAPKRPPDIPLAPAAFLAGDDKRARVLGSVVHLTLDEGYAELTDPQIAQFAGISTEAFHKQFANKEECFLAVLDEFVAEALDSVRGRFHSAASWPEGVYRAMSAFVEYLVAHEALLRMAFVDLFEVGPGMVGRMTRSVEDFTKLLTDHGPQPRRGPEVALEAVTGALWAIISGYVANGHLSRLPCLVDHLVFTVLAPYIGPKAAVEAIQAARKPLRAV